MNNINEVLIECIKNGDIKGINLCVMFGADINFQAESPLRWAIYKAQIEVVKFLLDRGVNFGSLGYYAALGEACESGQTEIVKLLLEKDNNNIPNYGDALLKAAKNGYYEIIFLILNKKRQLKNVNC